MSVLTSRKSLCVTQPYCPISVYATTIAGQQHDSHAALRKANPAFLCHPSFRSYLPPYPNRRLPSQKGIQSLLYSRRTVQSTCHISWHRMAESPDEPHKRLAFQMNHFFLDNTVANYEILKAAMEEVREIHPEPEVFFVHESMYTRLLPLYYGAPLLKGYDKIPEVVSLHTSV